MFSSISKFCSYLFVFKCSLDTEWKKYCLPNTTLRKCMWIDLDKIWYSESLNQDLTSKFSFGSYLSSKPTTVAAQCKAWSEFVRSNWGRGSESHSSQGCLCLFCVCVVLCVGSGLMNGSFPSKESYWLCIGFGNWKIEEGPKECREKKFRGLSPRTNYTDRVTFSFK
jgi:hypothetical protein